MEIPETKYAKTTDGVHIAFQVVGDGPRDLLYIAGGPSDIELQWEDPPASRFFRRLASFGRLILLDKRGTGLSDRVAIDQLPDLETRMDDVRAVMDTVGSVRAALFSWGFDAGLLATVFAATYPERVTHLILVAATPRSTHIPHEPWDESAEAIEGSLAKIEDGWGTIALSRELIAAQEPSLVGDEAYAAWRARFDRRSTSPGVVLAQYRTGLATDIRDVLPTVSVPTLVVGRPDLAMDPTRIQGSRAMAAGIPKATYVETPGRDIVPWLEGTEEILRNAEEFVTGVRSAPDRERVLATVMVTDIVASTERVASVGDARWKILLQSHNDVVRRELVEFRGREVDTAGDGFLTTFDGPARAVRCARTIAEAVRRIGLEIRAGCHTGEVELVGDHVRGLAVHIGARVASLARPSEVLVSSTVKDLTAGSGLTFEDAGEHELKGVPDRWRLYRAVGERT